MLDWASQFFTNPAVGLAGVAAVAVPIVIHLINRLRYRRVEFAAMQFLLASEEQNRRRILVEQLLLLLARILLVLLAAFLIGRLLLSGGGLAAFGAQSHEIVVLDDSLSMRAGGGESSAFAGAVAAATRSVEQAAQRGGTKVTVLRATRPDEASDALTEQAVDARVQDDVVAAIRRIRPTYAAVDWPAVFAAAGRRAEANEGSATVTVLTDARRADWAGRPETEAAVSAMPGVGVRFVRVGSDAVGNLAVTDLRPTGASTAVGVPSRFRATVRNFGEAAAEDVSLTASVDGRELPLTLRLESVEPNDSADATFDVLFETPGPHSVSVRLPDDALDADNERFYAADVPDEISVLLVDGDPSGVDSQYLADAIGANRAVTGYSPRVIGPDELARTPLSNFTGVYLLNVGDLTREAVDGLATYAAAGGGVVWFVGPNTRPDAVNERVVPSGVFPVPLADAPRELQTREGPDIVVGDNPVFGVLGGSENPFIDLVSVYRYFPTAGDDALPEDATVLASLSNGDPLAVERPVGRGRVVAILTSAGPGPSPDGRPTWNNWAGGPGAASFAIMALELQRYVTAAGDAASEVEVGAEVPVELPSEAAVASVSGPDGAVSNLRSGDGLLESEEADGPRAVFRGTDAPGPYRVRIDGGEETPDAVFAVNVPPRESELTPATDDDIAETFGSVRRLQVLDADAAFSGGSGREGGLRLLLVAAFLGLLCLEQLLAYRLSYHTR